MKLVSYLKDDHDQLAFLIDDILYDCDRMHPDLPVTMAMFLNYWDDIFSIAYSLNRSLLEGNRKFKGIAFDDAEILAPLPHPVSFRSIITAEEEGSYPGMIFLNHNVFNGAGNIICMPDHFVKLDFDLHIGIIISQPCKNISAAEADEYIGGFIIINNICSGMDQSSQKQTHICSAKGKDFATCAGPFLITPDELEEYIVPAKENHTGTTYDLAVSCRINGLQTGSGNLADMPFTFAEIIEQCSYGVQLYPGDVIGYSFKNGLAAFNKTEKIKNKDHTEQWLQPEDEIEIEIQNFGILKTIIKRDEASNS